MTNSEDNKQPTGDATDFINQQSELDKAKNERIKSNEQSGKVRAAQNSKEDTLKTDVSRKKTGGGKQVSPGT
ncbi:MAG TPA: hypothetical protein VGD65_10240 [Chryseosolibacter sp.]